MCHLQRNYVSRIDEAQQNETLNILTLRARMSSILRTKLMVSKKSRLDFGGKYQQKNMAAIEASYLVALRIAKAKKSHTIAEELLLPATKDIVRVMLGAEYVNKLNTISLYNNTVVEE